MNIILLATYQIVLIIVGTILLILVLGILFSLIFTNKIAEKLYQSQWARQKSSKFERGCSDTSVDFHLDMYNQGMKFRDENISHVSQHEIISLGLRLCAEYYDFGFKKAIIILPGRTETCYYGAYYAEAFKNGGYNVLCIDPRAHGLSEGDKITLGKDEAIDALEWAKYLHDNLGNESICLYGLCGGATSACLALINKDCPKYISSFIADGMFYSFYRLYKRHIVDLKKPVYPVIWQVMSKIKKYNHVNPYKAKPFNMVDKINVPVLFLSGEKDIFAIPSEAMMMFNKCSSKDKKIVFVPEGRHSHLRYDNKPLYDKEVVSFLKNH
ncbi:MAG TPA: hypothetical protein DDW20_01050 [Firmicutes bacterium]|mgnify:FL=1|nr:hypothetical protein [Bacillota bacterium]